jgi:hypothetical protein
MMEKAEVHYAGWEPQQCPHGTHVLGGGAIHASQQNVIRCVPIESTFHRLLLKRKSEFSTQFGFRFGKILHECLILHKRHGYCSGSKTTCFDI